MPQLSITGDQVNPLTLLRLFFFKCKNVHNLSKEGEKNNLHYIQFHIGTLLADEVVRALPLCSSGRNWWPHFDGERTSRQMMAGMATVGACRVTPKGSDGRTERAARPSSAVLPIYSFSTTSTLLNSLSVASFQECWHLLLGHKNACMYLFITACLQLRQTQALHQPVVRTVSDLKTVWQKIDASVDVSTAEFLNFNYVEIYIQNSHE